MSETIDQGSTVPEFFASGELSDSKERYTILERIAKGGMGEVFKAQQTRLNRQVAIKTCLPGADTERFRREAQLLASLESPHVVQVHDFDFLPDGRAILVMAWIEGTDLRHELEAYPAGVPVADAMRWMMDVCRAMIAAEQKRIVHRDLKPSNILLDAKNKWARVADFGLAWSPESSDLTHDAGPMGTPFYMSPEQAEDPRGVDTRADIYSFGATFYHLLTGHPPFTGATAFAIMFKHKTQAPTAPKSLRPELPGPLCDLLERCMAKNPGDRFNSFADVLKALQPATEAKSSWEFDDDAALRPHLVRYQDRRAVYLSGVRERLPTPDRYLFPGGQTLEIVLGNLAEERVDAVVSSDDGDLSMGANAESMGVAGALRIAGGPELHPLAQKFAPVRAGRAVVTPGFNLPARFVFHGVTIGTADGWKLPSRDIIPEIMESCFTHADAMFVKSIAFPLLGSGNGLFPRDVCLDVMFRFLARKFLHGLTEVRLAKLVIFAR